MEFKNRPGKAEVEAKRQEILSKNPYYSGLDAMAKEGMKNAKTQGQYADFHTQHANIMNNGTTEGMQPTDLQVPRGARIANGFLNGVQKGAEGWDFSQKPLEWVRAGLSDHVLGPIGGYLGDHLGNGVAALAKKTGIISPENQLKLHDYTNDFVKTTVDPLGTDGAKYIAQPSRGVKTMIEGYDNGTYTMDGIGKVLHVPLSVGTTLVEGGGIYKTGGKVLSNLIKGGTKTAAEEAALNASQAGAKLTVNELAKRQAEERAKKLLELKKKGLEKGAEMGAKKLEKMTEPKKAGDSNSKKKSNSPNTASGKNWMTNLSSILPYLSS